MAVTGPDILFGLEFHHEIYYDSFFLLPVCTFCEFFIISFQIKFISHVLFYVK